MLTIVVNLFFGWLLHFVGLEHFFHILLGFNDYNYYFMFFALGVIQIITRITKGE